ncbi:hypothetical protein C8R46DRAFT_1224613 [Mycena filopes]|nr:hypothetical protein C8R46DRAFT_1224613 [Mycena filopes]
MSFTSTPLGSGRRLKHTDFLGKPNSTRINSHTSYSYGAPALGSRSPPKASQSDENLAKQKRQNSDSQSLDPEKWSVKDTSVNVAAAFHQAATDMQGPNNAWASGSTKASSLPPTQLAAPPSRLQSRPSSSSRAKPLAKSVSIRHVPDSEGEDEPAPAPNGRGKSPFDHFDQVIGAAKRAIINAPAAATYYVRQRSREPDEPVAVNASYDYSQEERDVQNQSSASRVAANHKRNRMSTDNKAYKPSKSDSESDEDFTDDEGNKKKRRKKKKKEAVGGPLTSLPVAGYDKRKKKPKKGSKGNVREVEEGSDSDSPATDKQSAPRGSAPPSRRSAQPEPNPDTSFEEAEQGLHSIPEVEDEDIVPIVNHNRARSRSRGPSSAPRRFAPGALFGTFLHGLAKLILTFFLLCGKVIGAVLDIIIIRPARIIARSNLGPLLKYAAIFGVLLLASRALPDLEPWIPWGRGGVFTPPAVPAGNVAELAARFQRLEVVLSGLSLDLERMRSKVEEEAREVASRDAASLALKRVEQEMESLQALVQTHQPQSGGGSSAVEEARLKAVEERLGSVEGGLDLVKKGGSGPSTGAAWWGKGKSGLTIKSSDGQDVTAVISDLVNKAVGMYGKDNIGRADFALESSGAFVIPSLTSPTYEMRPSTVRGKLIGLVTGNGIQLGRPPITALHYDLHDGHCWPFAGSQGQLGRRARAPSRSAPREMEVWGVVEGPDNLAKLKAWRADRTLKRGSIEWIRVASFRYDIRAPNNIQTFPVDQEIRELGIDFGVVVLMVKSNWGMDAYTCLYRMRVHGQMMGATATPYPEELSP